MIFVGIGKHTPAQCPGHVRELFQEVASGMPQLPALAEKNGVQIVGLYSMMASHTMVAIMDAPDPESVEMLLYDAGLLSWNSFDISRAQPPEEAMKLAAQRFGL